ncbi:MAG: helix-turn-helix transcriptional regulator [Halohasta sp.]
MNYLLDSASVHQRELCEALSKSRSAVVRAVDSLEERGWVTVESEGVRLTPVGKLVIEEFLDLVDSMDAVSELSPFLEWFPLADHDLTVDDLRGGTVPTTTDGDPYAPVREHTKLLRTAGRFRALLPSVGQEPFAEIHRRNLAGDLESELIVSRSVESTLRNDGFSPPVAEMLATDRLTIHVAESIPFFLGLDDDRTTQIGVEDDEGLPRALFETTNESIRAWGEGVFAEYRESADKQLVQL